MLLGNDTIATYTRTNVIIWMTLAFQAGFINIGGLLACQSFVSHVTGFATLFGRELHDDRLEAAAAMLVVPVFFLIGVMISGLLIDLRIRRQQRPQYYVVFGVLLTLMLAVVIGGFNGRFGRFGQNLHENREGYYLLVLLCLICGIQNGMVALVSKAVIRTTHLTGITTDLGLGLVRVLNRKQLSGRMDDETRANWMRAGLIFFFGLGSTAGAGIFSHLQYRGFLVPMGISAALFLVSYYFHHHPHHRFAKP